MARRHLINVLAFLNQLRLSVGKASGTKGAKCVFLDCENGDWVY